MMITDKQKGNITMNLKEAFRFQNKLQNISDEATRILSRDVNITKTENTLLKHKVMPEAEDEKTVDTPDHDYTEKITKLVDFTVFILSEREKLFAAIRKAKSGLPIDLDGETSLNAKRQQLQHLLLHMNDLRSSEVLIPNGGIGYRFNAEGNQVSYKCDVKRVTTINFDRNAVRKHATELSRKADEISAEIDKCVVNTAVDYIPPFDVNDSFAEVFEKYAEA